MKKVSNGKKIKCWCQKRVMTTYFFQSVIWSLVHSYTGKNNAYQKRARLHRCLSPVVHLTFITSMWDDKLQKYGMMCRESVQKNGKNNKKNRLCTHDPFFGIKSDFFAFRHTCVICPKTMVMSLSCNLPWEPI